MATDFDEKEVYIGRRAQELRGLLKIKWPVEHGIVSVSFRIVVELNELTRLVDDVGHGNQVTDWDDMERIWNYVYREGLGTASEEVSRCFLLIRSALSFLSSILGLTFRIPAYPAPRPLNGSSLEPPIEQGRGSSDLLRAVQCPSAVH